MTSLFSPRYFRYIKVFSQTVQMLVEFLHSLFVSHLSFLLNPLPLHLLLHLLKRHLSLCFCVYNCICRLLLLYLLFDIVFNKFFLFFT
ncbi:unnamed protein product [Spodoptera exigua]|nr:unnamed protein product [Spodoptera exigua]